MTVDIAHSAYLENTVEWWERILASSPKIPDLETFPPDYEIGVVSRDQYCFERLLALTRRGDAHGIVEIAPCY